MRYIIKEELTTILIQHKLWLDSNGRSGARANFQDADLQGVNLRGADLRGADLRGADLQNADLRGANLDFSCLPLWCGGLNIRVDDRFILQLAYHLTHQNTEACSAEIKEWLASVPDSIFDGFKKYREDLK